MHVLASLVLLASCACIHAQQYGPVPPRPQHFQGATLVQPPRQNFRQRYTIPRIVPDTIQPVEQAQFARSRRPQPLRKPNPLLSQPQLLEHPKANLIDETPLSAPFVPTPLPPFQPALTTRLTPRPVQEEVSEEEDVRTTLGVTPSTPAFTTPIKTSFSPSPAPVPVPVPVAVPVSVPVSVPVTLPQGAQVPSGFQKPQFLQPSGFRPAAVPQEPAVPAPVPEVALQGRHLVRQQVRPVQPAPLPVSRPLHVVSPPVPINPSQPSEDEYFRQVQTRPLKKHEPVRQQAIEKDHVRQFPTRPSETVRQSTPGPVQAVYTRPVQREPHAKAPQRAEKKPVAQTIRKYHEEHEDGSITWGYENDDGSFKEETIGVDCVTRGKYGYYDPDGVKREYTYETGIPCVKAEENEEAESSHGYIDYTNNKYVFPNGEEIDLDAMVKNRARKPVGKYRS